MSPRVEVTVVQVHGRPPNWDRIVAVMGEPGPTSVFTYAPKVYVLSGHALTPDLLAHEAMHLYQQRNGAAVWWDLWLRDKTFRRDEELHAYKAQMSVLRGLIGDRNELMRIRAMIASDLAGAMYGSVMSFADAMAALR